MPYAADGCTLQRLFTTFADGWPGLGLFIQRLFTSIVLLQHGMPLLKETYSVALAVPEMMGAISGLFILAGLWTPIAGALVAAVELWIALAGGDSIWMPIMLAVLGGTLAMIGPGAWSIDARLFGRKRVAK